MVETRRRVQRRPLEDPGLWVERVGARAFAPGEAALFLDRDGTINVDTGYPADPDAVRLLDEIVPVIRAANDTGLPVVVVTNQSGIARGLFGWDEFEAVTARALALLADRDCSTDMVLACAWHEAGLDGDGVRALGARDHPMRKPNPGMLLRAAEILDLDLFRSVLVGDKQSDIEAGRRAGLSRLFRVGTPATDVENIITTILALRRIERGVTTEP